MDEETIKLQNEIAELKESLSKIQSENKNLSDAISSKDMEIDKMRENARKQGENFKRLRDMTEAEKELFTEKELQLKAEQEAILERQESFEAQQKEFQEKQRSALIENLANKYSKGDADIAGKIKANLGRLKDVDGAITEQELTPHIETAFTMLGNLGGSSDPLRDANNYSGQPADIQRDTSFADTADGQKLGADLGIITPKQ